MIIYIRNIKRIAPLLIIILCGIGCKKEFLDEQNLSALTLQNYFTTEAQAQAAINGIYPTLQLFTSANANYGESPWTSIEFPVGHATTLGQSLYNNGLIRHNNSSIEPVFKTVWVGLYNGIANANVAINKIPAIVMNEQTKKSLLGEAYFLRALYYFYLVRLYGDIPLITDEINFASPDLYPNRSPKEKVYDLIVNDLKEAEKSGLPATDRKGKASVGAVKSLLASVYLTMAGQPLKKGAAYYTLAADKAKEVIDMNAYPLFTDYYFLHDRAHKNQGELIFQVQYATGIRTNDITKAVTPNKIGISLLDEYGAIMPRSEFVKSYEANDKRAQEKQFFFTQYNKKNSTSIVQFGEYALYKYFLVEAAGAGGDLNEDQNFTIFRYPEVLLTYAEASNEVNGPTQVAYDQVNLIRKRANLPNLSGLSKDQFREAIWKERYHELAFENKAYFDIQRTGKVYNLAGNKFEDAFTFKNESGATFDEKYMLWPVPSSEIDANPKLNPQNPGWQ
jgi:starch-binding outer membrane protein, SusD/RagB family